MRYIFHIFHGILAINCCKTCITCSKSFKRGWGGWCLKIQLPSGRQKHRQTSCQTMSFCHIYSTAPHADFREAVFKTTALSEWSSECGESALRKVAVDAGSSYCSCSHSAISAYWLFSKMRATTEADLSGYSVVESCQLAFFPAFIHISLGLVCKTVIVINCFVVILKLKEEILSFGVGSQVKLSWFQ